MNCKCAEAAKTGAGRVPALEWGHTIPSGLSGSSRQRRGTRGARRREMDNRGVRQEDGRLSAVPLGWARCPLSQVAFKIADLCGVAHFKIFKKNLSFDVVSLTCSKPKKSATNVKCWQKVWLLHVFVVVWSSVPSGGDKEHCEVKNCNRGRERLVLKPLRINWSHIRHILQKCII